MRLLMSIFVLVLIVTAPLNVGCGRSAKYVKPYQCDTLSDVRGEDAGTVWECNRDVMVRAAKQKKFSLREFWGAAEFFERLTGIAADTRDSRQGPLPGTGLRENLEAWDGWYRENGDRLVWDPSTGSVRLSAGEPG
jgi:hypothetical protein